MSEQWVPKTPSAILGFALGLMVSCAIAWIGSFACVIPIIAAGFILDTLCEEIMSDQHPTPPQPEKEDVK